MNEIVESKAIISSLLSKDERNRSGCSSMHFITETGNSPGDFLTRLKSFKRWASKPAEVSPWWCSRYGWYCVQKDLLQCVECRQYLSAHLPSAAEDAILHRTMTNRLRASLVEAHTNVCLWRSSRTSEEICAPNVADYDVASKNFLDRLQSLEPYFPFGGDQRYFIASKSFDGGKTLTDEGIASLIETLNILGLNDSNVSRDACVVALLGWKNDTSCKESVCCDYCLRRIGLWLFRVNESPRADSSLDVGSSGAANTTPKNFKRLDPVLQHNKWCPWLMATSNSSALYLDSSEEDAAQLVPNWLALFRLLANPGATTVQTAAPLNTNEHYALARQLLNEALDLLDPNPSQADSSTATDADVNID